MASNSSERAKVGVYRTRSAGDSVNLTGETMPLQLEHEGLKREHSRGQYLSQREDRRKMRAKLKRESKTDYKGIKKEAKTELHSMRDAAASHYQQALDAAKQEYLRNAEMTRKYFVRAKASAKALYQQALEQAEKEYQFTIEIAKDQKKNARRSETTVTPESIYSDTRVRHRGGADGDIGLPPNLLANSDSHGSYGDIG